LLHEQARQAYEAECRKFEAWQEAHPDDVGWREKPATKAQWMLIRRTVDRLRLNELPKRITCGEAHDWLESHDANVRFRSAPPLERDEGVSKTGGAGRTDA
jgi:hypothetical protein